MTLERWKRTEELYNEARARAPGERAAFLAGACPDDEALRRDVESLLAESPSADAFFDTPVLAMAAPMFADQMPPLMTGQSLGGYRLRTLLGAGGMGEVYLASDAKLGRDVAIKILPGAFTNHPDRLARFEREARILATLNHPNICAIYDIEEADGVRFLVLELVEGETLAQRLDHAAASGLSVPEALSIARQIADALEAAHEKGIIHRDLKPANIKITPDGAVKVLDFGLAKALGADGSGPDLMPSPASSGTREGAILGTAAYMSPEQTRGKAVDKRADIWAFGCVLYEMLTGRDAFAGDTASDRIGKILEREPDWSALPASTPTSIRRLLLRCLAKEPKQRLRDIGDVRIEIDAIDELPTRTIDRAATRLPWIVAGALALGLALVLMLWAPWRTVAPLPTLRLRADLGADTLLANSLMNQYGDAAILSPDGTVIVFVAQNGDTGVPQLYVRRLDQLQARPLSGTDYAISPFFSPDSRWIGFSSIQKLKKIAVAGGAATMLSNAPELRGGTWGDDGTIVFSPDKTPGTRLLRVSSDGGTPEPVNTLAEGEGHQLWPQFLPGAKAVLYTSSAVPGAYNDAALVVQPLPGGPRKVVQRGGFYGRYLPSGHLVYIHDATLFAAPFSLDRLEITGQPVPALEGVASNSITGGAQFSVSSTGSLVYLPGPMTGAGIPLEWMNRDGTTSALRLTRANWYNPHFSPDGRRLAMQIRNGDSDIWIYDWGRDTLTRLTSDPAEDSKPVWTPDGLGIVFASTRGDNKAPNLYWQRADGTGEALRLTESRNSQQPGSWHPSGKFLAFDENFKLMILPMEGDNESGWRPGTPYPFSNSRYKESEPMFSPDGRWLAYTSEESGLVEVQVRPFPGPGGKWQVSTGGGFQPTWSSVKHELFYGTNGQIMVAAFTADGDSFRAEKPRLWSPVRYQTRGGGRMFDLHPDGQRIALARASATPIGEKLDKVVFILNFFEELRRLTGPGSSSR